MNIIKVYMTVIAIINSNYSVHGMDQKNNYDIDFQHGSTMHLVSEHNSAINELDSAFDAKGADPKGVNNKVAEPKGFENCETKEDHYKVLITEFMREIDFLRNKCSCLERQNIGIQYQYQNLMSNFNVSLINNILLKEKSNQQQYIINLLKEESRTLLRKLTFCRRYNKLILHELDNLKIHTKH